MAVLGAERRPGLARLLPVQPPLAQQRRAQARVPRRQARLLPGASLPLALPPLGSAREGRAVALRGLARARQASPGPGQGRARQAHQCQAVQGLAPQRVSSQPRPARSWIGHG